MVRIFNYLLGTGGGGGSTILIGYIVMYILQPRAREESITWI